MIVIWIILGVIVLYILISKYANRPDVYNKQAAIRLKYLESEYEKLARKQDQNGGRLSEDEMVKLLKINNEMTEIIRRGER